MMSYNSATGDINRLAKAKNLTMFYDELANGTLPQWMWITPNMSEYRPRRPTDHVHHGLRY